MRFTGLRGASFESWITGGVASAVHLALVVSLLILAAAGSRDAQWNLGFAPLFVLDLPVALVGYPLAFALIGAARAAGIHLDPTILMVAIANGLVGSAFYLVLPPAISAHRKLRKRAA
jgi:hypothetical protein